MISVSPLTPTLCDTLTERFRRKLLLKKEGVCHHCKGAAPHESSCRAQQQWLIWHVLAICHTGTTVLVLQ